jgi:hypothetical protein
VILIQIKISFFDHSIIYTSLPKIGVCLIPVNDSLYVKDDRKDINFIYAFWKAFFCGEAEIGICGFLYSHKNL